MPTAGRSLTLYYVDGNPDGMLTAEVFNWTGHVLAAPRTRISEALVREEAQFTGVYILLGELDGGPLAYIGESEDLASRIKAHDTKKDWWSNAVLVTSASNNLHKAHVKYLESRLVEEARRVGRMRLENGNTPPRSSLSEADQANMEGFLENLLMILPALRIDMFQRKTRPAVSVDESVTDKASAPVFELVSQKHNLKARAVLEDGEFVVESGSQARLDWMSTDTHSYKQLFEELKQMGVLVANGDHCLFAENYAFASPSAAGAMVQGRPTNGTTDWKLISDGRTYKQWEMDRLSEAAP